MISAASVSSAAVARTLDAIDDHLRDWIARQPLFFVATAPLAQDGHVNVSPKGPIGTLRVLGPHRVAYLDLSGSGAETVAHLRENGRIVVMLCAFEGPPQIIRLHGTGEAVFPDDERFGALLETCAFEETTIPEARRALVVVDVERIAKSCGYGVPVMEQQGTRPHYDRSKRKNLRTKGSEGMVRFEAERNATSIDGLPAVPLPERATP
jgi:Pyridoxamine 5'-phosphate oxidase